ncbi:MAG: hypothetical protein GF411_01720, partial [Candidatus Lokiarchaeota archaeon]|nr:hypothetical protein [Candidatus Woesearchaeota archaeon]MBD3404837.1 hypothetical protein [Candidatus Lokiarchaeota archaeon]
IKVNSQNGTSYTTERICVEKYEIWPSTKTLSGGNWEWEWRFASDSDAYFHVQVLNDADQPVAASKLDVELTKLTNIITGQTYNEPSHKVLNETSKGYLIANATKGDKGQQVINLSLDSLSLASGFYQAEIEVTDDEGSVDSGMVSFQISDLDVYVETKRSGSQAFLFEPTDTVQFAVTADYFNGSDVPDGSDVTLERLLMISGTTPKTVSTDIYSSTTNTTTGGSSLITLSPKSGKQLSNGDYLAFVKVDTGEETEIREVWFMVKSFFVYAYTVPYYYAAPNQSKDVYGFVFDPDYLPMSGIDISFDGFYDVENFDLVEGITASDTQTDASGSFTLSLSSTPAIEGTYVYVIKAYNPGTGETIEYMDFLEIKEYSSIDCSLVDSDQESVTPSTSVQYKMTIKDANDNGVSNLNVSVSKFTNTNTWTDRSATTTTSGTTNANGVATITVTSPSVIGRFRPIIKVNDKELASENYASGMWPCEIGVYRTEVDLELQDQNGAATIDFSPQDNISVNFMLTNPGGGAVDMNELKLVQYVCLSPSCMQGSSPPYVTTLGAKKTSNFQSSNILQFDAPSKKGTYSLVTQAKDTSDSTTTIPATFNVVDATFDYYIWIMDTFVDSGNDARFGIDTDGNLKVNVSSIKDMDLNELIESNPGAEASFSSGYGLLYNYSTSSLEEGTYEIELCVYQDTCSATSTKKKFMFTVDPSNYVYGRPYNPSGAYTADDNITLEIILENETYEPVSLADSDVYLADVWKGNIRVNSTFNNVVVEDSPNTGWKKITLEHTKSLSPGDYEAEIGVSHSGSTYRGKIYFRVNEYEFELITNDGTPMDSTNFFFPAYSVGDDVVFNITGPVDTNGTLYVYQADGWIREDSYTTPFTLDGTGFNQSTLQFSSSGEYVAVAAIPSMDDPQHTEAHYPFDIKAGFYVEFNWDEINDQIGTADNMTINFTVYNVDGTPKNSGTVNITVEKYYNPRNWNEINDSVGITDEVNIDGSGHASFSFDPDLQTGEYVAEFSFSIGANSLMQDIWFRISSGEFFVWSHMDSYKPGDTVNINAEIKNPDWSGIADQEVEITDIKFGDSSLSPTYINTGSDFTDAKGIAQLSFDLPTDKTGDFRVTVNWTNQSEIRTKTVTSSTLNIDVFETTFSPFSGGDDYILEVYANDKDYLPLSGVQVNYTIRSENDNWNIVSGADNVDAGTTDAGGKVLINYTIPADALGGYDVEINIGNGAAKRYRWFHVSLYDVYLNLYGEVTGEDQTYADNEIPTDANVIIAVDILNSDGSGVENSTVSIQSVRQIGNNPGDEVDVTSDITSITLIDQTDSDGSAELKFGVANLTQGKDYDVEIRISDSQSNGSIMTYEHRWFRIPAYSWTVALTSDPRLNDTLNYDVDSKGPNDLVFVSINLTGEITSDTKVCLDRAENLNTWRSEWYDLCFDSQELNASNGALLFNFSAPYESGPYEAVIELRKYENNNDWWMTEKEEWLWFEVLGGSEASYQFDVWSETDNVWAGHNATFNVELWPRDGWGDVDEEQVCGNITIEEIRNSVTWKVVKTKEQLTDQWLLDSGDPFMPMKRLVVTMPSDLEAGDYMAKVKCEDLGIERETWFDIALFQTAVLMPDNVMAKQNVSFWAKLTYYNGTPLANANISLREIRNIWSNNKVVKTFNTTGQTDENGEYLGSFIAPSQPSEYELIMDVTDGTDTQKIDRWFRIRAITVDVVVGNRQKILYEGQDTSVKVTVSDSQTGAPISDARVSLNMFRHWFEGGDSATIEKTNCSIANESTDCLTDDGCYWNTTECIYLSERCNLFTGQEQNCMDEPMCWYDYSAGEVCRAEESGGAFDEGNIWEEKYTNYNGIAQFDFSGSNALSKGEYELDIDVDAYEKGWFWTHKSFIVRKINLTLATPKLMYWPGEVIEVNVTANLVNGSPVTDEYEVEAALEEAMFANMEKDMECMQKKDNATCSLDPECEWDLEMMDMGGDMEYNCDQYDGNQQGCDDDMECVWYNPDNNCYVEGDSELCSNFAGDESGCNATQSCGWISGTCEPDCDPGAYCETYCPGAADCGSRCDSCDSTEQMGMCIYREQVYDEVFNVTFDNGLAQFNFTVPSNQSAGPIMLISDIVDPNKLVEDYDGGGLVPKAVEFLDGMILVMDNGTSEFILTVENPTLGANEFVSVNISSSPEDAQKYALAPGAMHLQSAGGVISMQQLNGGGPESGKEDYYGGEIYLNPEGTTHTMVLSRNRAAEYVAMLPLVEKGSGFMMGSFENVFPVSYEVNSSAGECTRNYDCNDNDNQTWDVCVLMKCVHNNISAVECSSDYECPNTPDQGIYGICDWTGQCVNITGSCSKNSDCDDSDNQTIDYCEYYECVHENSYEVECTQSSDCTEFPSDGQDYTAFCEYGKCDYVLTSNVECTSDSDCNQGEWCDSWDHQCHYDMGGNCECNTTSECTQQPYGADTISECWCMCEYYNASDINWLYSWNTTRDGFGNESAGVEWGWEGNEDVDEAKPFWGNPGGDVILASVANDSDYLYVQMETGGFDFGGGIPYCGGSYPSSGDGYIKGERFVVYYNTTTGGNCNISDADYMYEVNFSQSSTYMVSKFYECSGGSWVEDASANAQVAVDCGFGTIDYKVNKSAIGMTDYSQIVVAVYMRSYTAYSSEWTTEECDKDGCIDVAYSSTNVSSLIDRVPNSGWQWINDTGWAGWADSGMMEMCGDGVIDGAEECDDDNMNNGDGCSDSCEIEPGYVCTGEPSSCEQATMSVDITTPNDNVYNVAGSENEVMIVYNLTGNLTLTNYSYTHIYLDDASVYNDTSTDSLGVSTYNFTNLSEAAYTLNVTLVNNTKGIISTDTINFSVQYDLHSLSGYVLDTQNNPIEGVLVDIMQEGQGFSDNVLTTAQGFYNISSIPLGNYSFNAEKNETYIFGVWTNSMFLINDSYELNLTWLNITVNSTPDKTEYNKSLGENVTLNVSVINYEGSDLFDWNISASLYFDNGTYYEELDEIIAPIVLNSSIWKNSTFELYLNSTTEFTELNTEGAVFTDNASVFATWTLPQEPDLVYNAEDEDPINATGGA